MKSQGEALFRGGDKDTPDVGRGPGGASPARVGRRRPRRDRHATPMAPPGSTPAPGPGSGDDPSPNHALTVGALYTLNPAALARSACQAAGTRAAIAEHGLRSRSPGPAGAARC